jgi:antitoxin ParD1/3/4
MPTRNINLTAHLDTFIQEQVDSGRYGNASEVVRDALRLIERRTREDEARQQWLREATRKGLDQLESGEYFEFASIEEVDAFVDQIAEEVIGNSTHSG